MQSRKHYFKCVMDTNMMRTSASQSIALSVNNLDIMITSTLRRRV